MLNNQSPESSILQASSRLTENPSESCFQFRALFENMACGFVYCKVLTDKTGKAVDFVLEEVNDSFQGITGLKKTDVIGKRITTVIPGIEKIHPELFELFGDVALNGKKTHLETFFKPFNGWFFLSIYSPQKNYFAMLFNNITEQKSSQKMLEEYSLGLELTVVARTQELKEAQNNLLKAERFAAIGELAGMIGHDLRNPLTSIRNAAYYLQRKQFQDADPTNREMFEIIDKSVMYANKIVDNLLEYSRTIYLEIEECSPKSLIDYILLMITIPNHVKIVDKTLDEPIIWVDAHKLERVFMNIIKNAIDAMPEKGTLEIRSQQIGDNVEFTFADTGMGMSEQTLSKLFTPLFTTKAQGMGFGLAICKRIIDAHNGKITVDSALGKGTTFTITLPIQQKLKVKSENEWLRLREDSLSTIINT